MAKKSLATVQRRERFEALVNKAERMIEESPQAIGGRRATRGNENGE